MTAELTDTTAHEGWGPERSRTVTWHDPGPSAAKGLSMAGVDYLRAMIDGTLPPPPVAGLMQFDLVSADPGRVVFNCRPDESAYNPIGAVHGGLVCALAGRRSGLCAAQYAAAGQGLHLGGDQGQLPQGGPAQQWPAHRDRDRRQVRHPGGLHRKRRHRRLKCDGGHCLEHVASLRPLRIPPQFQRNGGQILVTGVLVFAARDGAHRQQEQPRAQSSRTTVRLEDGAALLTYANICRAESRFEPATT